ncbi:MAG: DUF1365 domain-containing protein [Acidimicrobiia bacterium]
MRSAIYEGTLVHRRFEPDHRFHERLAMPLLDPDEVDEDMALHPLWSRERPNVVSWRHRDHPEIPWSGGRVAVLAHVRTWGWLFNPIALHYCYGADGRDVEQAVAVVTNTPWKERHEYVLGPPGRHEVDKALHVSPFFGMDQRYTITYDPPGEQLRLAIDATEGDRRVFSAALRLQRHEISRAALGRVLWRHPMLTARVSAGIHTHALRLWRKGATFHPHPDREGGPRADAHDRTRRADQVL